MLWASLGSGVLPWLAAPAQVRPPSVYCEVTPLGDPASSWGDQGAGNGFQLLSGPVASGSLAAWGKFLFSLLFRSLSTCFSQHCWLHINPKLGA